MDARGIEPTDLIEEKPADLIDYFLRSALATAEGVHGTKRAAFSFIYEILEYLKEEEPRPLNPRYIPAAVRRAALERDAYRCKVCDGYIDLQVDHIKPVSLGGLGVLDNLQTLCRKCNQKKGCKYECPS